MPKVQVAEGRDDARVDDDPQNDRERDSLPNVPSSVLREFPYPLGIERMGSDGRTPNLSARDSEPPSRPVELMVVNGRLNALGGAVP